nr:hypothetical protein [Tanacetum cinerariifolium]
MSNDHSIPKRNKFGALLPIELANAEIKNSKAYKEYYTIATREAAPKPKASVRRTKNSSNTSKTPPTAAASPRLTTSKKGKQTAKSSKAKSLSALFEVAMTEAQQLKLVTKRSMQQTHISQPSGLTADEETGSKPGVPDVPTDESEEELSWNSTDDEGDDNEEKDDDGDEKDEGDDGQEGNGDDDDDEDDDGEEGDDDVADQEVVRDDDKDDEEEGGNDELEFIKMNLIKKQRMTKDLILSLKHLKTVKMKAMGRGIQATLEVKDSYVTLTPVNLDGQQQSSSVSSQFTPTSVAPLLMSALTMTPSTIATITATSQAPILPTTVPSNIIQNLLNFSSLFRFDDRLRSLEANVSEAMQTNQFAGAVSAIPGIVHQYMDQQMNEAVKVAVQIQSDRLRDEAQRDNDEFLKTVDENMKTIIKEQTSYAVATDLSGMELKKILIKKIEGNKSIQRSDEQRNLYKALVEAYESNKIILDTYREIVTLKRRRDDDGDKDEEPSAGPDRGSKRWREGKEPESASALTKTATRSTGSIVIQRRVEDLQLGVKSYQKKLNLTKLDSYRSDLKCKEAYTAYSNPQGFIYQNKDKRNRLMRINELHKFSNRTLTDVRTALDDRLKGIRMQYLPQSIWRKSDKDRAAATIWAIDKRLKTRRIGRSLERFVGGRLYEGDFQMLQRTI